MQSHLTRKRGVAFFDLDHTISDIDTFRKLLKVYYISSPFRVRYSLYIFVFGLLRKLRLVSLKIFKQAALVGFRGMSKEEIHLIGDEFFKLHLEKSIRSKAIEYINMHKINGDLLYIISASPDIYLKAICDYLGCDGYICTQLEYIDNTFTGKIEGCDCIGEEKKLRAVELSLYHNINLKDSFAYTDHEADMPLLESVGHPLAISPTKYLREKANENSWAVEDW